jgi:ankyrin repeat protein
LEGADINGCNSIGWTVLKLLSRYPIKYDYFYKLITHPKLNINQQDKHGGTALLACLINRQNYHVNITFINAIVDLLNANADPELPNKKGLTPLNAAKNLDDQRIIDFIEKAIEKKHTQKRG